MDSTLTLTVRLLDSVLNQLLPGRQIGASDVIKDALNSLQKRYILAPPPPPPSLSPPQFVPQPAPQPTPQPASQPASQARDYTSSSSSPYETRLVRLPDTTDTWPWPRAVNVHYEEAKVESTAWLQGFYPFTSASQQIFDACDFSEYHSPGLVNYAMPNIPKFAGLLASLAYPWLSKGEKD